MVINTLTQKWLFGWKYLVQKPTPREELEEIVTRGTIPDYAFFFMIAVSSIIATLGLLANSAAVIIGAMIIAPLMSPIIAISYWLLIGKRILIFRSFFTVLLGTILSIAVAYLISEAIGWKLAGSEIVSRMKPNLLDLGVALAAGAAAAFAYTRSSVSSAFAGIAISVALVPPLCTVGIALALKHDVSAEVGLDVESFDAQGPLLLYITNFFGIIFAASLVFFWQYFKKRLRAILILAVTMVCLAAVVFPLGLRMKHLLIRNQVRRSLTVITISLLPENYSKIRLSDLSVRIGKEIVYVRANVVAPPGVITQSFIDATQNRLTEIVEMPVAMEVGITLENVIRGSGDLPHLKNNEEIP